ncbi:MAG: type II toxin-antitoxin system MqsA family antitoxin [Treponema sp.]|nr:type II toxin-antitoxin system MqsA family antitoxin [Treponema sp.]MBQ7620433.1 type II toxin-antitoxin system MqsA family antitoxin [Treponema sp.]MBQ9626329.1 type II toxin-antitoxin system MqsA family antitoxin [Treponema sp.]
MKCLACKNDTMIDSKTSYFANLQNCYLIIENVPCKKCSQCGEEVFSVGVMERIDQLIASVEKIAGKVCVLEYQSAA